MPSPLRSLHFRLFALLFSSLLAAGPATSGALASVGTDTSRLQGAFAAAAREFGVPPAVLLAVAYHQSRWEHHAGAPSTSSGYGIMHLTSGLRKATGSGRNGEAPGATHAAAVPMPQTLPTAAALLGLSPTVVATDPVHNIRGGAALLAQYARETTGTLPADQGAWYGAVARFSGSDEAAIALSYADGVYASIRQGVSRTTADRQTVTLAGQPVTPDPRTAEGLRLRTRQATNAECPVELACQFIPAAYQRNDPNDPTDYGNYDVAQRPDDGLDIRYIVIHDTEIPYATTIAAFQNPRSYVTSHYVLRAADGATTQMVANKDVAWGAGNWYINMHSINIEHEGVAIEGAAWYSEAMYRASARLVRYLADRFDIPLDRSHILGHDDVPGPTPGLLPQMHWDPGPFWDWAHYMELVGAPLEPGGSVATPAIVTIAPRFATNMPVVDYCLTDGCREVPRQPASFIPLHTAPSHTAPLVDDPALPGPGTTQAYDWGTKAATGQRFYRVARQGDWDGIFFSGQLAWFHNPGGATLTAPGSGTLITARDGLATIPVYGRAYPEASAYPAGITPQPIVALPYTVPAGQIYVATERVTASYYWSPTQTERRVIRGDTPYYALFFNHRLVFVKASDVRVVSVVWQPTLQAPVRPATEGATR
jgi:N-acetyl-anhydromuramyl-L-alanine amidase AmpD